MTPEIVASLSAGQTTVALVRNRASHPAQYFVWEIAETGAVRYVPESRSTDIHRVAQLCLDTVRALSAEPYHAHMGVTMGG